MAGDEYGKDMIFVQAPACTENQGFPYSMPGEIDAYLTDYNWAVALAKFFSNTGNSDISIHRIFWRWFAV